MFSCQKCNKECTTKSGLTRHVIKCINETVKSKDNTTCEYCKEIFSNKWTLNKHIEDKNCKEHISFIVKELEQKEILLELQTEQIKKLTNENRGLSELYQKEKIRSDELMTHYKQLNTMINLLQK